MLHVGLYENATTGTLVFDLSPHVTQFTFGTDEHGFADCKLFAPLSAFESFWVYQRALVPYVLVSDNGEVIWEGRLEDPRITNKGEADSDGLSLTALGYYRSLSDEPHTAVYTSVTANTIVAGLLASALQLSSSTALIQNPGVTLSESYDDKKPSEILDRLTRLGDSATPPRIWEACVWENRMLVFRPRGEGGRDWYVDASEIDIERTLQTLYNSAYGIYFDATNVRAVSATATDQASVNRWGVTRRQAVKAQTRSATLAATVRDTVVEDGRDPAPRAEIEFEYLYDATGARWPSYYARSGHTITIRNLPPMMSVALNRIRTFRILETKYNPITNKIKVTPESPLATLEEQLSGGPSSSPSSHSSPLSKVYDDIDNLIQEIHGGPGGGGGGGGGGTYLVPGGAIMLFDSATCPAGWTEYTAARGRTIVGVPSGGTVGGTVGSALADLATRTISTVVAHVHAVGTLVNAAEAVHTHGVGSYDAAAEASHTHGVGSLDAAAEAAHTHGVGTYDAAAEASHTHGVGTYNNATEAVHTHGVGSYDAAAEADHTHGVGAYNNATEAAHTHSVNPPSTTSAGHSVDHNHAADPPNTTSTSGGSHSHAPGAGATSGFISGKTGGELNVGGGPSNTSDIATTDTEAAHTHDVNIAGFFTTGANVNHTHDVDIAAFTSAAGSVHDHAISGSSAAGSSHDHAISGTSAAGSSHDHAISGSSAAGSSHDHALSGSSAAGSSHDHALSGSVGAGTSHDHTLSGNSGAGASHNHAISGSVASTGSATVDVTMPYIQLLLCKKD